MTSVASDYSNIRYGMHFRPSFIEATVLGLKTHMLRHSRDFPLEEVYVMSVYSKTSTQPRCSSNPIWRLIHSTEGVEVSIRWWLV